MFRRLMLAALLAATLAFAQRGGGGAGGMGGDEMGGRGNMGDMGSNVMTRAQRQTKEEQLAEKLKLNKEQKEQLAAILSAAREKAAPLRDALLKGRLAMAQSAGNEDQLKKAMADYSAVVAQMDGVEAEAFGKIFAMLKPNQQSKAGQGFELMAGMFEAAGRGQGMGMGRGRGESR